MKIQFKLGSITVNELAAFMDAEVICMENGLANNEIALLTNEIAEISQNTLYIVGEDNSLNEMMAASKNGACSVLCTKAPESLEKISNLAVIVCDNVNLAVERFAKQYSKRNEHKTIALTGAKGKTRTGEFIYSVLEEKYNVFTAIDKKSAEKNDALALLSIPENTDFFLAELKLHDKKDIARLAGLFDTDVGVITTLEGSFGEAANVNVLSGVKSGGEIAFCNDDDVLSLLCRTDITVDSVSVKDENASLYADNISEKNGHSIFDICGNDICITGVEIPFLGEENIKSALFAALIGLRFEVPLEKIRTGLKNCHSPELGVRIFTENDVTFIVDSSSATAGSMTSGIDTLCDISKRHGNSRMLALLGDIRDFGQDTRTLHEKMGEYVFQNKVDKLFTYGIAAEQICVGARRAGMSDNDCSGNLDLFSPLNSAETVADLLTKGDTLLIRIGRQNAVREIVDFILKRLKK